MDHPEGAGSQQADWVKFRGAQISSDGDLLVMRELYDALGLSDLAASALRNIRRGKNTIHRLDGLFRQSVFGRLAGYEDVNYSAPWPDFTLPLTPSRCRPRSGRAAPAPSRSRR